MKVEVGLDGVENDPPLPLTTLQLPVPMVGVFAAIVTNVFPHVAVLV